jgi:hypothetical protein
MRFRSGALCLLSLLSLQARLVADITVRVGNLSVTAPTTYQIKRSDGGVSLIRADGEISVRVITVNQLPLPTPKDIQRIVADLPHTSNTVVTDVKSSRHNGSLFVTGKGTVNVGERENQFWLLSTQVGDRAAAGVGFAPRGHAAQDQAELLAILKSVTPALQSSRRFFGFEESGLSNHWMAQGDITIERKRPPTEYQPEIANDADPPPSSDPKGDAIHLSTPGNSIFLAVDGLVPNDWSEMEAVSFWVYRANTQSPPTTIELRIFGKNPRSRFWRKLVVDHQGWKRYSIPLRWMRWGDYHTPEWNDIGRFAIYFRDAGDIWIDSILLEDVEPGHGATLLAADLATLVPQDDATDCKLTDSKDLVLVSTVSELDTEELQKHLSRIKSQVEADFSFLPPMSPQPKLAVLSARAHYQDFVMQLAAALNSQTTIPNADGFTLMDVSASYWDPTQGTLRPVYAHEYLHGLLGHRLRFANQGDWLHEGAATYYQLRAHPQANLAEIIQQGIEDRNLSLPLEKLCNGKRIPLNRYWQAFTMVDLLLNDAAYRLKLPELIKDFQSNGSTELGPPLIRIYKKSWQQLTDDWRSHCRVRFSSAP